MAGNRRSGRKCKPTEQLKAEGGYRKERHDGRLDAVPAPGQPERPEGLTQQQRRLWQAIVDTLPKEALGSADETAMVELVEVFGLMLAAREKLADDPIDKDTRIAYSSYFDRWFRLAGEFGLTPSSRASLKVPSRGEDADNPMVELLARFQGIA